MKQIHKKLLQKFLAIFLLAVMAVACEKGELGENYPTPRSTTTPISTKPSLTSFRLDTLAIPAGWMTGNNDPEQWITILNTTSKDCYTGAECQGFEYKPGGTWGGIISWSENCGDSGTDDAWNKVTSGDCGVNLLERGNFKEIKQLTFWARGKKGSEVIKFEIGGDDFLPTPKISLGQVTLNDTWKKYTIDLDGVDLTQAIGLFIWVANDADNPNGAIFYLDDIKFEGNINTKKLSRHR